MNFREADRDLSADAVAPALLAGLSVLIRSIRRTKVLGGLTLAESSALSHLGRGPKTSAELAKLERITPQSMGATVSALEEKGLIRRAADPTDGRRQLLTLTPTGTDDVDARRICRTDQLTAALAQFSAEERGRLVEVLPLLERLAELMPDAPVEALGPSEASE